MIGFDTHGALGYRPPAHPLPEGYSNTLFEIQGQPFDAAVRYTEWNRTLGAQSPPGLDGNSRTNINRGKSSRILQVDR